MVDALNNLNQKVEDAANGSWESRIDGETVQKVKAGDVITMSAGCRHTVMADTELKLIEVQLGEDINVHDKQKFELEY